MATVLIGIDDTDNKYSPGTGQLAQRLVKQIESLGGKHLGTTGHQFLIDPGIPYTGHNRGICVAVEWDGTLDELNFVFERIKGWSTVGSDPGVCLAFQNDITPEIKQWANKSLSEVLKKAQAIQLATAAHLQLRELGGTGGGIIGALASVGLRAIGENGRFVDMKGLRAVGENVTTVELAKLGIEVAYFDQQKQPLAEEDIPADRNIFHTRGWLRPHLAHGKPVWAVKWSGGEQAWVPLEPKKEQKTGVGKYRRLHSLFGVLFGLFLVVHLSILATTVTPERFTRAANAVHQLSTQVGWLELVAILGPLLVLLVGGSHLLIKARLRYDVDKYKRGGKLHYFIQRVTALILLIFLLVHVGMFSRYGLHQVYRLTQVECLSQYAKGGLYDPTRPLASIAEGLRDPLGKNLHYAWLSCLSIGFYSLGILAAIYHLANGLWTGALIWGICESEKAQKYWGWCCFLIGLGLSVLGGITLLGCLNVSQTL